MQFVSCAFKCVCVYALCNEVYYRLHKYPVQSIIIQSGPKSRPLLIYQQIVLKLANEAIFSLKLNVEQATEVNANTHLLVLDILSIKYDVKCDVNYCVYTLRYG